MPESHAQIDTRDDETYGALEMTADLFDGTAKPARAGFESASADDGRRVVGPLSAAGCAARPPRPVLIKSCSW